MSLLSEAIEAERRPSGAVCHVALLLADPPEGVERDELLAAIEDRSIPAAALARAVRRLGGRIETASITRHRRRECMCERSV